MNNHQLQNYLGAMMGEMRQLERSGFEIRTLALRPDFAEAIRDRMTVRLATPVPPVPVTPTGALHALELDYVQESVFLGTRVVEDDRADPYMIAVKQRGGRHYL